MLTDNQFESTAVNYPASIWSYYGFGFIPNNEANAVGAIEHTRLGATRYYIQVGPITKQIWQEVSRDRYHAHLKSI
jgi:hypothetical protein